MCLDELKKYKPCVTGYKIMEKRDGKLYGEFRNMHKPRPMNEWLDEGEFRNATNPDGILIDWGTNSYPFGWHVFHFKKHAMERLENNKYCGCIDDVMVKVEVAEPITTGLESINYRITVAKKIKIVEILK